MQNSSACYDYEADWRPYVFPEPTSRLSSLEEIRRLYPPVTLTHQPLQSGGMPVWSDGNTVCLNTRDEMTLGIGFTGAGKSRRGVAPTIAMLAKARENIVAIDVKGELTTGSLSPYVRGVLEENGYQTVFFDLRGFRGDGFNPLLLPYRLYREGNVGEAIRLLHEQYTNLSHVYNGTTADPFWTLEGVLCLVGFTCGLFAVGLEEERIHMLSLAMLLNDDGCSVMQTVRNSCNLPDIVRSSLNSILSMPERTRMSVVATAYSMLQPFVVNDRLMRMTSCTTFDFEEMTRHPCAVFLIVPDEVDSYDPFVGILLDQLSGSLVQQAYRCGGSLPIRTNFVCDEFAQYFIQNMSRNISAHRSRNIRWYIWCQGLEQLKTAYPKDAPVILENCANLYFMNSPELGLLKYLSERSGSLTGSDGLPRPLLRVQDLQTLQKTRSYTETYFSAPGVQFISRLPDISQYPCLQFAPKTYTIPCHLPHTRVLSVTPKQMMQATMPSNDRSARKEFLA